MAIWGAIVSICVGLQIVSQLGDSILIPRSVGEIDWYADDDTREGAARQALEDDGGQRKQRVQWGVLVMVVASSLAGVSGAATLVVLPFARRWFDGWTDGARFRWVVAMWAIVPFLMVFGALSSVVVM